MARFAYVATGVHGERASGVQRATNREAAELALYEQELRDIRLTEKKSFLQAELLAPRIKREDVMYLSRQLAAFVRAGLPLIEAVHSLGVESSNSSVRRMMAQIEDDLRRGDKLSECLDAFPKVFPEYFRGIVRSAELTGELDVVLEQLAKYLERDLEARRRITGALIYPSVIAVMAVVTVTVLAGFVLPKFKSFFDNMHAKLPLATRMLLAVTNFLTAWWWAVLAGVVLLVGGVVLSWMTARGRYMWQRLLLSVPVLGETIKFALVERFCRTLASMVSAGVSLPEALRVATDSLRNLVFVRALSQVGEAMLEGEGLARPLARIQLFPRTASQMLRVGEDTGALDAQLEVTAQYYESELDYKLKKLMALFEPAVIVVMGLLVGFVAIALVSAMYGIFHQVHV
jgi:type IV pilus assembly protein PilC